MVHLTFKIIRAREEWVRPRLLYLPSVPPVRSSSGSHTSWVPYLAPGHASRVLGPFFLGFLSSGLFRLQNIKHQCVVSLYFSCFLPLENFDPGLFSLLPPVHLPLPIFSRIPTPFLIHHHWNYIYLNQVMIQLQGNSTSYYGNPYHSLKNLLIM